MQLLELLTQASGGRTEDLSFRNNAAAEVVNRVADAGLPPQKEAQPAFVLSPRKASNPFAALPSAAMFEQRAAAPSVVKAPLFGGAVQASAPTVWKQPPAPAAAAAAAPAAAPSPVAAPPVAIPVAAPKKMPAKVVEEPAKAAAPPAKFNPFAAVGSASPAVKRGPVPPPPGQQQPLSATRAVPPPPK